jgi:Tfp pilus assembly protein PilV
MVHSPSRAGDAGFALIEAVISAVVLAVVALAVLSGIEGSIHSASRERSRSIASTLAEQDQERMRAMSADNLADMTSLTRTIPVKNINYTVTSTSEWIRDDTGGTVSCTNNSAQVDYLRINTTVKTNLVGRQIQPVTMSSIVAPPVGKANGTLAVQVSDRNSVGISGLDVTATADSGGSFTETTNTLGCAIFTRIPVDTYAITLNRSGWVDTFGRNPGTAGANVVNNTVQVVSMKFDRAAAVNWSVTTKDPWNGAATTASNPPLIVSNPTSTSTATQAGTVSAVNGEEPTAQRTWTTNPATSMFPFLSKYSMWTGSCSQSNPATWDPDYYDTFPGAIGTQPATTSTLNPAMQQPSLMAVLQDTNGAALDTSLNSNVYATVQADSTDATPCSQTYRLTNTKTGTTVGRVGQWRNATVPAAYTAAALPFGKYDICATYTSSGGRHRWKVVQDVDLTTMSSTGATAQQIIKMDGTGSTSTTPPASTVPCPPAA